MIMAPWSPVALMSMKTKAHRDLEVMITLL
jgi:hypothetical protein